MTTVILSAQVLLNTTLQTTFDYVADLSKHPEWSSGELKIEAVSSDPIGVGKEYLSKGEVVIQKDRPNKVTVTEFEPPHKFGFVAQDPDFGRVFHEFTFARQNGGVLVTRTMTFMLNPLVAFLFQLFIFPLIGRPATINSLAALKAKLESQRMVIL